ncbi:MAG TPA: response regulator transcription factor [Actinomycetota bacterium]|nr:response regulator transcription factor [Actinomycetota bacterium]
MTLRVLITEDHKLVSQGLETMLSMTDDIELVGVVDSGPSALDAVKQNEIDVVLMDVNLGAPMSGIEATRLIKEENADTKVLILTMFTDPGTVAEAVKAGADGYLSKGASREAVAKAIHDVHAGRSVLDPNVTEGIFGRISGKDPHALTDRELTVLQELSHGRSTREVAERIHVSEETVKTYLKQIFRKLGVHDRTEAVAEAFRRGLVH